MMTMKVKLKQNLRSHDSRLKFNVVKLKDPEVADLFDATSGGKFSALASKKSRPFRGSGIDARILHHMLLLLRGILASNRNVNDNTRNT